MLDRVPGIRVFRATDMNLAVAPVQHSVIIRTVLLPEAFRRPSSDNSRCESALCPLQSGRRAALKVFHPVGIALGDYNAMLCMQCSCLEAAAAPRRGRQH